MNRYNGREQFLLRLRARAFSRVQHDLGARVITVCVSLNALSVSRINEVKCAEAGRCYWISALTEGIWFSR